MELSNEIPKVRTAISIDPKIYDVYIGQYGHEGGLMLTILKEEDRLLVDVRGRRINLFSESETQFL